jgi:cell division protein FtsB
MLNDSTSTTGSTSSPYSSSSNSNSNSLNRSVIINSSLLMATSPSFSNHNMNDLSNSSQLLCDSLIHHQHHHHQEQPEPSTSPASSVASSTSSSHNINTSTNSHGRSSSKKLPNSTSSLTKIYRNNFRFGVEIIETNNHSKKRRSKSQTTQAETYFASLSEHNHQLIQDILQLKNQLKDKDKIIEELREIRNKLENEMQELSASLFEQAYSMVNTARAEKAQAEKLLKEANGKIEVIQAEVKALKELVITSTPSAPNKHLLQAHKNHQQTHNRQLSLNHQTFNTNNNNNNIQKQLNSTAPIELLVNNPNINGTTNNNSNNNINNSQSFTRQISSIVENKMRHSNSSSSFSETVNHNNCNNSSLSVKTHRRTPSDQKPKSLIDKLFETTMSSSTPSNSPPKSSINYNNNNNNNNNNNETNIQTDQINSIVFEIPELDTVVFDELVEWKNNPQLEINDENKFMKRIYSEDVEPCLNFQNNNKQVIYYFLKFKNVSKN